MLPTVEGMGPMEQRALKIYKKYLNIKNYSHLETSAGQL
jgi:hypothetical protein